MPDILVRDIDPETKRLLQLRAREHNRSISDEAKALIRCGLDGQKLSRQHQPSGLGTFLSKLIPPEDWTDDFIVERDKTHREPPDFS